MKVAFFSFYPPDFWAPAGGITQLKKTAEALGKLGVEVELFDIWKPDQNFDILHVFGSTYQLSDFVNTAKEAGGRVIVSSISYSTKPAWKWRSWKVVDSILPVPTVYTYRKRLYEAADRLLVLSNTEARQLDQYFGISKEKMRLIPNGADLRFAKASPEPFIEKYKLKDFILSVGRINNNKGQLRVIKALKGTNLPLVFIGPADPNNSSYFKRFKQAVSGSQNVHYIGSVPHESEMLSAAYASAKVHVLPSLSECFELVTLEAGLAGCNLVVSRLSSITEYLGNKAVYCDPKSTDSIRETVMQAYNRAQDNNVQELFLSNFTWDAVAEKILDVYEELLGVK